MTIYADEEKKSPQKEAEACVEAYYEALSEGDAQKANALFEGEDGNWRKETILSMKEHGMEKFDELQIDEYPVGNGEEEWLFVVTYEIRVEGIETGMPGLSVMRAFYDKDKWVLNWNMTIEGELEEIWNRENISEKVEEWDQKYADAAAEDEKIGQWIQQVSDTVIANMMGEELPESRSYVVEKGDCLWTIAEEQLGESVRWVELYEANETRIGEDPDWILPGMELLLP